jgi:hypothetical protein
MSDLVQEVGARLTITGGSKFVTQINAARDALEDFNEAQEQAQELAAKTSDALDDTATSAKSSAATVSSSAKAAADATSESADAASAALGKQADAQDAVAASAERSSVATAAAAKKAAAAQVKAADLASTQMSSAVERVGKLSTKILEFGGVLGGVGVYEGIKNWMSFQQTMSQGAISAGVNTSWLPQLTKGVLAFSNATGLAAEGTNGLGDAMYRLYSANPGKTLQPNVAMALLGQAGQLAELSEMSGAPANPSGIAQMFGAIASNKMSLTRGGAPLPYTGAGAQSMVEWLLSTAGHGDVKLSDLQSAMSTGLLAAAATTGVSLNEMGALFDVLSPAIPANVVGTRLSTSLGALAMPKTAAKEVYELFGGNATTAKGILQTQGVGPLLNYIAGMFSGKVTGANFYSQFMGSGLGSLTGGSGGKATGAIAFMRSLGFTPGMIGVMTSSGAEGFNSMSKAQLSAIGFGSGVTGPQAVQNVETQLLGAMFGGANEGRTLWQLINERGTYNTKLGQIQGGENSTAYEKALKLAYAQPMRQWDIFVNKLKNLTITIGQDVTPKFDDFLHDLESLGNWFGKNKGDIKDLEHLGETLLGIATLVKVTQGVAKLASLGGSVLRIAMNPSGALKSMFGQNGLTGAAVDLKGAAAALTESAGKLGIAGAENGAGAIERDVNTGLLGGATTIGGKMAAGFNIAMQGAMALGIGYAIGIGINDLFHISTWAANHTGARGLSPVTPLQEIGTLQQWQLQKQTRGKKEYEAGLIQLILQGEAAHPTDAAALRRVRGAYGVQVLRAGDHQEPSNSISYLTGALGVSPSAIDRYAVLAGLHVAGGDVLPGQSSSVPGLGGLGSIASLGTMAKSDADKFAGLVAQFSRSVDEHKTASDTEQTASETSATAARELLAAANKLSALGTLPSLIGAALSPGHIYELSQQGRRAAIARK